MRLILQKDVKNLGKAGDQANVKKGYARNFLIPKGLALPLNKNRLKVWKHQQVIIEAKKRKALADRKAVIKKLSSIKLKFEKESQKDGKLFGSVTAHEISQALEKIHKLSVDKRDISPSILKSAGDHKIAISLDAENKTEILLSIKGKSAKKEEISGAKEHSASIPIDEDQTGHETSALAKEDQTGHETSALAKEDQTGHETSALAKEDQTGFSEETSALVQEQPSKASRKEKLQDSPSAISKGQRSASPLSDKQASRPKAKTSSSVPLDKKQKTSAPPFKEKQSKVEEKPSQKASKPKRKGLLAFFKK